MKRSGMPRPSHLINLNNETETTTSYCEKTQNIQNGGREDDLFGRGADLSNNNQTLFDNKNKAGQSELYKFKIPWGLRLAYSLTFSNDRKEKEITTNSLMMSGNIDLAVKWKMGFSSGYDFANKGLSYTQLRFERDLESWRMSFSIVPVGIYNYWNFFIGILNNGFRSVVRALKISRTLFSLASFLFSLTAI